MVIYSPLCSGLKEHNDFQFLTLHNNIINILDLILLLTGNTCITFCEGGYFLRK